MTYLQQTIIQASALIGGFVLLMLTVYLILKVRIKRDERKKLYTNQLEGGDISVVEQYKKLSIDIWNLKQKGLTDSDIEIQSLEKQRQNIINYIRQLGENRKSKIKWSNHKEVFLCGLLIVMSVLFICFLCKIWDEVRFIYIFLLIILFFGSLVQCVSRMGGDGLNIDIEDDKDFNVLKKISNECCNMENRFMDVKGICIRIINKKETDCSKDCKKYQQTQWLIDSCNNLYNEIHKAIDCNFDTSAGYQSKKYSLPYNTMFIIACIVGLAALLFVLYQIWYYVCCGFLCFEFESLGDKIMAFIISMIGLGFVGGFIAICFGWNPPD